MARALWTGSLSFGLVSVPIALFAATQDHAIRFNQFQAGTADRVRNKRVNERTGEEVPYDHIVKGFDIGGGEVVILSTDDIASAAPEASRMIDVSAFVDLADIDPIYFDRAYYLAPGKGGDKVYALLLRAMQQTNRVAVGTFVMREVQHLAAVRPRQDVLVLETLRYGDEVRDPRTELGPLPVDVPLQDRELEMAAMLIDTMTTQWRPEDFADTHRDRLMELIERKRVGAVIAAPSTEPRPAPVVDLLQALEASVQASRRDHGAEAGHAPGGRSRRVGATSEGGGGGPARAAGGRRPRGPGPGPGLGGRRPDDLADVSKAELLRRAADLDVPGRTRMSRQELQDAIRGATVRTRRKVS